MITYPIFSNFCKKKIHCNVISFTIFYLSRFFYLRLLVYFSSTEKWNKIGKYPNGVQIFAFLLEYRLVWRQGCIDFKNEIWQMTIWSKNVFKGNLMFQFSWFEEFRQGKVSWRWTLGELQHEKDLNDQL